MRLVTRLVLSHAALAAILVGALAVMLASVGDIGRQVRDVRERDLATIDEEEQLHRAAWAIEVAARHGLEECDQGVGEAVVSNEIADKTRLLEQTIAEKGAAAARPIREAVGHYVKLAEELERGDTCEKLRSPEARRARLKLDEDLTNAWINRLYELHGSLARKEATIDKTGKRAITSGIALGALAMGAALLVAASVARGVTNPLARLANAARRVGHGDFSPIPVAGGPSEVRGLSLELERMRVALAELDALKQSFLASVSHELRTPLGKMREALALLSDGTAGALTERQRPVVEIARRACETEIRLVTTILDLSRLRAGKRVHRTASVSLDDVVREAVSQERIEAAGRDVRVDLELVGEARSASLDAPMLERAVANVVRNAVSVSKRGSAVRVVRELRDRGPSGARGAWACVRIRDEGPGIPDEIAETLFQPFATREIPGRGNVAGIGLGLALARAVLRSHGGEIVLADGAPGRTTFELWIPLADETEIA